MNINLKSIEKLSNIELVFLIFLLILIISLICSYKKFNIEGFVDRTAEIIIKNGLDIYDDFYSNIFDVLFFNKIISDFEIGTIINSTEPNSRSIILDIGSKTGYTINILSEISKEIIGTEVSTNLIKKAVQHYPHLKDNFLNKNPINNNLFENSSFTHILLLNNNIYNFENKKQILENCYHWLIPGGYLALNLFENQNIDPINNIINIKLNTLPKNVDPTLLLSDSIKFKDFIYTPNYSNDQNNKIIFKEKFNFNNGNIRKHESIIYYMAIDDIIKIAKYLGYIVLGQYKINSKYFEDNYIYIFQKPN